MYRLFIDEVGHHNLNSANDPNERYLGLVGAILDLDYSETAFTEAVNALKMEIFGTDGVILHRRELIDKKPAPYDRLEDQNIRARFNELLMEVIDKSKYTVITVLIDKQRLTRKYSTWHFNPYHYCLTAMIERYVHWLEEENAVGDVLAEARAKKFNIQLENSFKYIYRNGTGFASITKRFVPPEQMQRRLTSGDIKTKTKKANVAALQLVDMIANPACRHLICRLQNMPMTAEFGRAVVKILIERKYRRCRWGDRRIMGFGVKLLP